MDLIKRHKGLALVGGLTLILVVIIFIIFARMIFSNGDSIYGNRLDNLVKIDKKVTKEIISEVSSSELVEDINIRVQGRIIYTTILFKEGIKLEKAKEIANATLDNYSEKVLGYYDLGYFLKEVVESSEDKEKTGFVVAGTKHPQTDSISWTKN